MLLHLLVHLLFAANCLSLRGYGYVLCYAFCFVNDCDFAAIAANVEMVCRGCDRGIGLGRASA